MNVERGIDWIIHKLRGDQYPDGSWRYPFETGISGDAYMIILLRSLELEEEELIQGLAARILSRQERNGSWKLFHDERHGNLTVTIDAYYALLFSGFYRDDDPRLVAARNFIVSHGGLEKAGMFSKIVLAITGQLEWPDPSPFPIEVILLPLYLPLNFYSFSVYGRANMTPVMILADKRFSLKTEKTPDLKKLLTDRNIDPWTRTAEMNRILSLIEKGVESLLGVPDQLHAVALDQAKKYMLERIEPDGTFYSYFSSTFFMIFALLALGYRKDDPVIAKAVAGLISMKTNIDGLPHMQFTTANVWNTALINVALQDAGMSPDDPLVLGANQYLLKKQHVKRGDWALNNPATFPGGWGFSDINTINPDVDDTTAAMRSITRIAGSHPTAWNRGINWLLSMQNDYGGWPAFEKNKDLKLVKLLPIEKADYILNDPSCADLTGRTLEFFGNYTTLPKEHDSVVRALNWLTEHQEEDGSWYGRWGICYIYGTWTALTGMHAVGVRGDDPVVQKAVSWLLDIQNDDGGWGESCYSDIRNEFVPLGASTLAHTAWALDALISFSEQPTKSIQQGIAYLLAALDKEDWTTGYPAGQGLAGALYIHYHSYRYIFPLMTLAHYKRKYQ